MATLCITPHNTQHNFNNVNGSHFKSNSDEPPKISKFFSNSSNYQSKIQQLISFSFTSSNFIFITFILSISKLCTTAATDPSQAGAAHAPTAVPNFLMNNFNGSALLEKLNSFRGHTVGPPTVKGKNTPAAANSLNHASTGNGVGSSSLAASAPSVSSSTTSPSASSSSSSVSSLDSSASSLFSSSIFGSQNLINMDLKFLNVSGKIGTPLGIGK